jgi:hypothetical protein
MWNAYMFIDGKRRRNFIATYYVMLVSILVYMEGEVHITDFSIPLHTVSVITPALILIFANSYIFLCAHSFVALANYLRRFQNVYSNEIEKSGLTNEDIQNYFQQRDATAIFNIFNFSLLKSTAWDQAINNNDGSYWLMKNLKPLLIKGFIIVGTLSIFLFYLWSLYILQGLEISAGLEWYKKALAIFYFVAMFSISLSIVYFSFRVAKAKHWLEENLSSSKNEKD